MARLTAAERYAARRERSRLLAERRAAETERLRVWNERMRLFESGCLQAWEVVVERHNRAGVV